LTSVLQSLPILHSNINTCETYLTQPACAHAKYPISPTEFSCYWEKEKGCFPYPPEYSSIFVITVAITSALSAGALSAVWDFLIENILAQPTAPNSCLTHPTLVQVEENLAGTTEYFDRTSLEIDQLLSTIKSYHLSLTGSDKDAFGGNFTSSLFIVSSFLCLDLSAFISPQFTFVLFF
jgi:hypothetical protein